MLNIEVSMSNIEVSMYYQCCIYIDSSTLIINVAAMLKRH